ncbi:PQQ-binding-like beta-propeller repeat protein [bacterium]|nr:PQQ-binding-like beta-propeller repeat protein [bacterium]
MTRLLPILSLMLLAITPLPAEDWPTLHRDGARSGVSGETWAPRNLQVAWSVAADEESVDASPAVVGGRVFVGTAGGAVVCLSAADGAIVWRAQTGGAVMSSPAVAGDRLFVGSADRCLYAFSLADGKRLWTVRTRGAVVASPLVVGDRVYCGSMDGTFRCLSAADGKELWRTREQGGVSAGAASAGDLVYLGDEAGNVVARAGSDGKAAWSTKVAGGIVAAPCVVGEQLIVPVMSPTALSPPEIRCLLVLDRHTGNEVWSCKRASSVMHTPVCDGTNVYFAVVSGYLSDTELLALRLSDGVEMWKRRLGGVADSSPVLAGGVLLLGTHDANFCVVDKDTGTITQALAMEGKMFSSPALVDGHLYIGVQGGRVVCLK